MKATSLVLGPLQQVALSVRDLDRSVAFFRDGVGLEQIAVIDPPGIAFFRLGETRLLLERSASVSPGAATLYFRVADIDAAHAALRARGIEFEQPPHLIHRDDSGTFGAAGEEEWMAFFKDPDGHDLAIAARMRGRTGAGERPR